MKKNNQNTHFEITLILIILFLCALFVIASVYNHRTSTTYEISGEIVSDRYYLKGHNPFPRYIKDINDVNFVGGENEYTSFDDIVLIIGDNGLYYIDKEKSHNFTKEIVTLVINNNGTPDDKSDDYIIKQKKSSHKNDVVNGITNMMPRPTVPPTPTPEPTPTPSPEELLIQQEAAYQNRIAAASERAAKAAEFAAEQQYLNRVYGAIWRFSHSDTGWFW